MQSLSILATPLRNFQIVFKFSFLSIFSGQMTTLSAISEIISTEYLLLRVSFWEKAKETFKFKFWIFSALKFLEKNSPIAHESERELNTADDSELHKLSIPIFRS